MLLKSEKIKLLKEAQAGNLGALSNFKIQHPNEHWCELRYDKTGDSVLHVAARLGHYDLVRYLLENYTPNYVDCKNLDDKSPLHEACQFAHYEIVKYLLENGADVNALKRADWTPLMLACTKIQSPRNVCIVEDLLKQGALVNYTNKDGWSALHLICREGDVQIFHLLKRHSADVNKVTKNGRTGLHIAALHGHCNLVQALLDAGVDVNAVDSCGNTPLHEAVLGNSIEICKLLIDRNANIGAINKGGFNLLHLAASEGLLNIIKYLVVDLKFDMNTFSDKKFTPLHCAAKKNQIDAIELLVSLGGDKTIVDELGRIASCYLNTI